MPFLRSSSIVAGIRLRLVEAGLTSIGSMGSMGKHKFGGQKIVIGAIEIDTRVLRLRLKLIDYSRRRTRQY